jgi:UDP-2-acetamido-2-deoxy-ribo-hexuluronate aminotransferase
MAVPFVDLKAQYARLKTDIDRRIHAVLEHGRYVLGPEVEELERKLAEFAGCADAVGVASGTDALLMALMAEEIGPGDGVFLPAFTFTATAEVVLLLGATPIFVDVRESSFNIDPAHLEHQIEETARAGKVRPRAIIPVDLFGLPADYDKFGRIAAEHNLVMLADAAQSFGARLDNRRVGSLAPMSATSFFPAKPLGCYGDGGAIFVQDEGKAQILRSIRMHGQGTTRYEVVRVGVNGRLDTLQAAVLLSKLTIFEEELEARERVARSYDSRLAPFVSLPPRAEGAQSAWAQYSILSDKRDLIAAELKKAGIPTAIYYPRPMHLQPAYAPYGTGSGSLPVSESLSERILSLPMHPYVPDTLIDQTCSIIESAVAQLA